MIIHQNDILGLVLAGGQHRRMGDTPKWQLLIDERTILQHVLEKLSPQVGQLVINGTHSELKEYHYPVIKDSFAEYQGPLAGLLAGLEYAQQQGINWLACCPCDTPFFPNDIVASLSAAIVEEQHIGATIEHEGKIQGVFGLWHSNLASALREQLENSDLRSLNRWIQSLGTQCTVVDASHMTKRTFFNINTPSDWATAKRL